MLTRGDDRRPVVRQGCTCVEVKQVGLRKRLSARLVNLCYGVNGIEDCLPSSPFESAGSGNGGEEEATLSFQLSLGFTEHVWLGAGMFAAALRKAAQLCHTQCRAGCGEPSSCWIMRAMHLHFPGCHDALPSSVASCCMHVNRTPAHVRLTRDGL